MHESKMLIIVIGLAFLIGEGESGKFYFPKARLEKHRGKIYTSIVPF